MLVKIMTYYGIFIFIYIFIFIQGYFNYFPLMLAVVSFHTSPKKYVNFENILMLLL